MGKMRVHKRKISSAGFFAIGFGTAVAAAIAVFRPRPPRGGSGERKRSRLLSEKVSDFMTKDVRYVDPEMNLDEAARLMKQHRIGILPVCEKGKLVGVISDRDITVRAVSETLYTGALQVRHAMSTRSVVYCHDDQNLGEAIQLMKARTIRRLPVLDREGSLVGILSIDDLASRVRDARFAGDLLQRTARRYGPRAVPRH